VHGTAISLCPACSKSGFLSKGGGFQDPMATALSTIAENVKKALAKAAGPAPFGYVYLQGAGSTVIVLDGMPLLSHWSRFGLGSCLNCGLKIWHDFGGHHSLSDSGQWHYYCEDFSGQLSLF